MGFTSKEVKRAIRDFNDVCQNLLQADSNTYQTRVKELINLIEQSEILSEIMNPYFNLELDHQNILIGSGAGWKKINLPENPEEQIAYVLQVMKSSSEGKFAISMYAFEIFKHRRFDDNLQDWNLNVLVPVLRKLGYKLDDLIEDEIEGHDEVSPNSLSIFNYGNITAEQGNVAIGKDITQTIEIGEVSKKIIDRGIQEGIVNANNEKEIESVAQELEKEVSKTNPSQDKLKGIASRILTLGDKALMKIATEVVTHPNWAKAVTDFLLS